MRIVVLVAVVAGLVGLLAALQALSRAARLTPAETYLRPLAVVGRTARTAQPPELAQLETLVADALRGDRAATARLATRLAGRGVDLDSDASPDAVLAALQRLPAVERR